MLNRHPQFWFAWSRTRNGEPEMYLGLVDISRLQRSPTLIGLYPGPLAQASTCRALGAFNTES